MVPMPPRPPAGRISGYPDHDRRGFQMNAPHRTELCLSAHWHHQSITVRNVISLSVSHRGLNKQGYKCRREYESGPTEGGVLGWFQQKVRPPPLFTPLLSVPQNATRPSTRSASTRSSGDVRARRPTAGRPWWVALVLSGHPPPPGEGRGLLLHPSPGTEGIF